MRKLNSTCCVNYKIVSETINVDYLKKSTNCFSYIFWNNSEFDINSVITLTNFRTEELEQYIEKYFEILSNIFKIELIFLDKETIEVKGFKSLFHLKIFLTLYRILFELTSAYSDELVVSEKQKRITFFDDLCNSNFEKLDYLEQLLTSHNKSEIYMGNHGISYDKRVKVRIISIEEFHNIEENLTSVTGYFTDNIIDKKNIEE